jgi:hypothetical protein
MGKSTYRYHPLKTTDDIRLLRIPSKSRNESYEIVNASLEDPPPYEAISYTWGEERTNILCTYDEEHRPKPEFISCPENCCRVLKRLRKKKTRRLVWVDSICINQDDRDERSRQVAIMDQVYMKARRVLVWLGDAGSYGNLAMAAMRRYQVATTINSKLNEKERVHKWIHGIKTPLSNQSFSYSANGGR